MAPPGGTAVIEEDYKLLLGWLNDSIRLSELEDLKFLLDIAGKIILCLSLFFLPS